MGQTAERVWWMCYDTLPYNRSTDVLKWQRAAPGLLLTHIVYIHNKIGL